ncbi:MAG: UDP-N-acetylmuramate--L-alanine ligase, partial [Cyanobacteria bacterium]|nr:UDP-N-acetylmuramate--L-alanine ligase [Cyanobacteriota bacterium]
GSLAVAEMDESDGSLIQYHPTHTIVSNLELDHADHYTQGLEEIVATFQKFLGNLKPGSSVFLNWQCPTTQALGHHLIAENLAGNNALKPIWIATGDVFSGAEKETTYWIKNSRIWHKGCYQGYVYRNRKLLGELNLSVPGLHNLFNALAAVAVGVELGGDFEQLAQGIREFTGMGRRFEKLTQVNGAWLVDDYAHHPTEVSATLKAARASLAQADGKVIAIFQPHRFTRLQAFWEDFQTCFKDADRVYLTDVYPASEAPIEGVTTQALVKIMENEKIHPQVAYVAKENWSGLKTQILESLRPQDIALSMGAGDITQFFR